jgi:CspA family cold shock protein
MPTGRIRWFDHARGYGFLQRDDDHADVFFHVSGLSETGQAAIVERGRVTFDVAPGKRGDKATNIESIHATISRRPNNQTN